MSMSSLREIRQTFLNYFEKQNHTVVSSSPLVPHNDPTLMFTNAGMNQFKDVFTGVEKRSYNRATSSQKCVRAGGKHNDLDNVGYTARHHTFFEMLGNFSFGDYFKEGAIPYAWELLTKEFGLNKDKLWITIYHDDDAAFDIWKKVSGFSDNRIIRINSNDNFWSMGDTGPCGPCSEIYYNFEKDDPKDIINAGDDCVEIWNLVFMQYEQVSKEVRNNLPKPSIDTGMGLERLASVLQGVRDNYDTDLFKALIAASEELSKTKAQGEQKASHRVIADHLRSTCFLIADGVLPSNEGRGYVLRRIMRRAMRHVHLLGAKEPMMYRLVPTLIEQMGEAYPELKRAQAFITENLKLEEERFKQTLDRGLKLLDEETASIQSGGKFSGESAFKLYDTYGFPLDLTEDILRGKNIAIDQDGFNAAMKEQKDRARAAWSGSGEKATGRIWFELKEKIGATEFLGYDSTSAQGVVRAIVKDGAEVDHASGGEVYVVLNQTPFYGESGGQVGDEGFFFAPNQSDEKSALAIINDTIKPLENFIVHKVTLKKPLTVGDTVQASVNVARRNHIRANHSATHILHAVLRKQLGEHITQKGSLVDSERLRFDISHPKGISRDEIAVAEKEVNRVIAQNTMVETKLMTPDDAVKAGAMALFGEKYGDEVRVLSMGIRDEGLGIEGNPQSQMPNPYSVELCGGTHVRQTGEIGLFKITSEGSVASGVRRIEAVTGEGVRIYAISEFEKLAEQLQKLEQEHSRLLTELKKPAAKPLNILIIDELKNAKLSDVLGIYETGISRAAESIKILQDENKKLARALSESKKQSALGSGELEKEMIGGIPFVAKVFDDVPAKELRAIAEAMMKQLGDGIVTVASSAEGKASFVIAVSASFTSKISAVDLVREAAAIVGGSGGGGRPEMAQAGGTDVGKIAQAVDAIRNNVRNLSSQ